MIEAGRIVQIWDYMSKSGTDGLKLFSITDPTEQETGMNMPALFRA